MGLFQIYHIAKKCAGEARWSTYQTFSEKLAIFKTLFKLRYRIEVARDTSSPATVRIFDFHVTGTTYGELLYLFREIFLQQQYKFASSRPDPAILDCGANIGMAILFFKRQYPHSTILAFEPNPKVFACLQKNIADNGLKNVHAVNAAVAGTDGKSEFFISSDNSLISSIDTNRGGGVAVMIDFIKLSNELQNRTFDFAKIDIEGAEFEVIDDLKTNKLLHHVNEYVFEYHHNMKGTDLKLSEFLRAFEENRFSYSLESAYEKPGDFQDIRIHCIRNN